MTVSSLQVLGKVEVIPWIFFKFAGTNTHCPFKPRCAPFCLPTIYINGIICKIKVSSNGHRSSSLTIGHDFKLFAWALTGICLLAMCISLVLQINLDFH